MGKGGRWGWGALHDVRILLGAVQGQAREEVGEEGLQHRLQLQPPDPRRGAVLDRQEPLHAACGVGMHNAVLPRRGCRAAAELCVGTKGATRDARAPGEGPGTRGGR